MVEYIICFLKQGDKILLLNRDGVDGKIEQGETPLVSALREIKEETGIALQDITYKGKIAWADENINFGCMYAFIAELPDSYPM